MRDKTRKKETVYRNYIAEYLSVHILFDIQCMREKVRLEQYMFDNSSKLSSASNAWCHPCAFVYSSSCTVRSTVRSRNRFFIQAVRRNQATCAGLSGWEGEKKKLSISPAAVRAKKQRFTLAWDRAREGSCEREDGPPGLPGRQVEKEKERILFTGTVYSLFGPSRNQAYKLTLKHHMV